MADPDIESGGSTAVGERDPDEVGAEILAKARAKYPRYRDVPDDKLAAAISAKVSRYEPYLRSYVAAKPAEIQAPQEGTPSFLELVGQELHKSAVPETPEADVGVEALKQQGGSVGTIGGVTQGGMNFARSLATPMNALLGVGAGAAPAVLRPLISGYFATDMGKAALAQVPALREAWGRGDTGETARLLVEMGASAGMAGLAGTHAVVGAKSSWKPKPAEPPVAGSPVVEKLKEWNKPKPAPPTPEELELEAAKKANSEAVEAALQAEAEKAMAPPAPPAPPERPPPPFSGPEADPSSIALLKQTEAQKGYVEVEDIPKSIAKDIIAASEEKFGPRGKSPITEQELLDYAKDHGFDLKMKPKPEEAPPSLEQELQQQESKAQAMAESAKYLEETLGPEDLKVKEAHEDAVAQAALVEQLKDAQPKEHIAPNPRANPVLTDEAAAELGMRGIDPSDPQAVANEAARVAGLTKPVKVTPSEEPVSESLEHDKHYEAKLTPGDELDKPIHEVSHMKDREAELRRLTKKGDLTRAEGEFYAEQLRQVAAEQYDKGIAPLTEATAKPQPNNTLDPKVIAQAQNDLIAQKPIYAAVTDAARGVFFGEPTAVDKIMTGEGSVSAAEFYDAFLRTRDALREQFGDTITLFRAEGKQVPKATQNWATTEAYARQFGEGRITRKEVPIEQVLAVNVGTKGTYHELIVGEPPPAEATKLGGAALPPSTSGGATPEGPGANDQLVGSFMQKLTGGPTGSFSRRSIKVNEDLQKIADEFETITDRQKAILEERLPVIEQKSSMGREQRKEFRKEGITTPEQTLELRISAADAANITARMTLAMREAEKFALDVRNFGDPLAKAGAEAILKNVDTYMKQYKTLGTTWARIGHRLQMPPELMNYLRQTGRLAEGLRDAKIRRPIYTNIVESIRNWGELDPGQKMQLWHDIVDAFRLNLFSVTSFSLDLMTNLGEIGGQIAAGAGEDVVKMKNGQVFPNLRGFMQALGHRVERQPMHPAILDAMGHTAGGEILPGFGTAGFGTFTRRGRPEAGGKSPMQESIEARGGTYKPSPLEGQFPKLMRAASTVMDYGPGTPLYAKGFIDKGFGNLAAMATLYAEANKYTPKGLSPLQRREWREQFIADPAKALGDEVLGQKVMDLAIRRGNEAKFNRDLAPWQEKTAADPRFRAVVDMFGRWAFQFSRWAGEMVGLDPRAWKRITKGGQLDTSELARYLAKAATGLGGLYMLNSKGDDGKSFYDRVDFYSMEYVKGDGNRVRLVGREPVATALVALALFKAATGGGAEDWEKFRQGLPKSSIPFGKFTDFSGGLISGLVNVPYWTDRNRKLDPRGWQRDLISWANSAIPGKSLLSFFESIDDPVVREGFGANVPGVSRFLDPATSQTTGRELEPEQSLQIPFTDIKTPKFRTVGGVPIPGATRELDPIHRLLMRWGARVYRGPRQPLVGQPPSKIPDKLRKEWEQELGYARSYIFGPVAQELLAKTREIEKMPKGDERTEMEEEIRKFVSEKDILAGRAATQQINDKYGLPEEEPSKPEREETVRELAGPNY